MKSLRSGILIRWKSAGNASLNQRGRYLQKLWTVMLCSQLRQHYGLGKRISHHQSKSCDRRRRRIRSSPQSSGLLAWLPHHRILVARSSQSCSF